MSGRFIIQFRQHVPFVADDKFDRAALPPARLQWYELFWAALRSPRLNPNPFGAIASGKAETIGFTVKQHVALLAWLIDRIGDPLLVVEFALVMNALRDRIEAGTFHAATGKDSAFLASLYALAGYTLTVNGWHSESIREAGDFWAQQALNLCAAGVPSDDLMHSFAASAETARLLYLLTGETRFAESAEEKRRELVASITLVDGRATWEHRLASFMNDEVRQKTPALRTTYARYTMQSLLFLHRLGVPTVPMEALARQMLFLTSKGKLFYWMDGAARRDPLRFDKFYNADPTLYEFDEDKFATSLWSAFHVYDGSGELEQRVVKSIGNNGIPFPYGALSVGG
jgi:hypothetical protein